MEKQARRHVFVRVFRRLIWPGCILICVILQWEAVAADCWTSYAFGRPSSWSLSQIDAQLPELNINVESEPGQSCASTFLLRIAYFLIADLA